ncbi:transketolase [Candidatus Saccharibacteria bacterium]|nr:transketolase [Candidatus Saccharibacteria bacterium]
MESLTKLKQMARTIRCDIITTIYNTGSGHPGGSLSVTDILTVLYFNQMNIDPKNPNKKDRDRFVLSKGHASPALYSTLARRGYFPIEELAKFRKINGLEGHPDMRETPGVDMSTGSLGQGISAAGGMAMAGKLDNLPYRVYTVIGDGEAQEGQVWEAAMTAGHHKLDNLCVIVDYNKIQSDGFVRKIKTLDPLGAKFRAFGFAVITIDGNDIAEIIKALNKAKATKGKPTAIIANTIKGKGVSYMENEKGWHGVAPNAEQYDQAMKELGCHKKGRK